MTHQDPTSSGERVSAFFGDGQELFDMTGGWTAHNLLCYSDPDVLDTMTEQVKKHCPMDMNIWANRNWVGLPDLIWTRERTRL